MTSPLSPIPRHVANLWSLVDYKPGGAESTLEQKLEAVKAAGFDGFTTNAGKEHARLAAQFDLLVVGFFSTSKVDEMEDLLRSNRDAGAKSINVQLADHDTPVEESVRAAIRLNELADKLGVTASVEVHRDTCTETPEKTYAIAEGYRRETGKLLTFTWDFSHLSVVKHLAPPYWERLLVDPQLVQQAEQFHFRPFNGHHCQVPVTDGKGGLSLEITQWIPFLEKALEMWVAGDQAGREVILVPEMGPVDGGYNFAQLPNSWEDAIVLRRIIADAWTKALG